MFQRLFSWRRHTTPGGDATPRHVLYAFNTRDARDLLSQLLRRVARGEEIVIAHAGRPVAKLVPYAGELISPGVVRGRVYVRDRPGRRRRA
ncbi:MAG TPA: type II toxin-antitoxin system prevent-host-death family antitoxin [Gaiellaceae bacterium]|nr:type II toxin-antitoxin system prevent-host-death family antitoxin [Gaiellaceae bacterium]